MSDQYPLTAKQLIKILRAEIKRYGDLPIYLANYDTGLASFVMVENNINEVRKGFRQNELLIPRAIVIQ